MGTDPTGDEGTIAWREVLAETEHRVVAAGLPAQEAHWIVEEASGSGPGGSLDDPVTARGMTHHDAMVGRRLAGEPLQYVLGRWAFRGLDLMVDPRVLIPRPETEVVAGLALAEVDRVAAGRTDSPVQVADLGTGSGAIGLSIAVERIGTRVWCTDVSTGALAVARANCAGLGRPARRVTLAEGSWFEALPTELKSSLDVVVANPPYVDRAGDLPVEVVAWEPAEALFAERDGRADLEALVDGAPTWLAPGGALVLEMSPDQAGDLADRAREVGFDEAEIHLDLAGRDRAMVARLSR